MGGAPPQRMLWGEKKEYDQLQNVFNYKSIICHLTVINLKTKVKLMILHKTNYQKRLKNKHLDKAIILKRQ